MGERKAAVKDNHHAKMQTTIALKAPSDSRMSKPSRLLQGLRDIMTNAYVVAGPVTRNFNW